MSTEMDNDKIDSMFNAITRAVLGLGSMEEAARAVSTAMCSFGSVVIQSEEWPEVVLEDLLDAEFIQ